MRDFKTTKAFDKDIKKMARSGKNVYKIERLMNILIKGESLPRKYRDHKLEGVFKGRRDCHIEYDWLLIYKLESNTVVFERTGSHADLFD